MFQRKTFVVRYYKNKFVNSLKRMQKTLLFYLQQTCQRRKKKTMDR